MNPIIAYVIAAGVTLLLLLSCGIVAKRYRNLPWLAGTSSAMTLFLAGVLAITTWFAPHAFLLLVPVWSSLAAVALVHLLVAKRAATGSDDLPSCARGKRSPARAESEPDATEFSF